MCTIRLNDEQPILKNYGGWTFNSQHTRARTHLRILIIFVAYIALNTSGTSDFLSALQNCPVIGFWLARTQCMHFLHSLGSIPTWATRLNMLSIPHWLHRPTGYPFNTWVESGKCRSMSCQRTLVPRRNSNRGPCDRQSGDAFTRPQHLYNIVVLLTFHRWLM